MSIKELHYDFKVKIDKVDSLSKEDFNVAEIDWLLNEAQEVFIKQRYGGNNYTRKGFEESQKRIEDLSSLVVRFPEQPAINATLATTGIYEAELSDLLYEHLFIIRAFANVLDEDCGASIVSLRPIQTDDLNFSLEDPFNKSSSENGYLYTLGKNTSPSLGGISMFIHVTGSSTITDVRIEYIKTPRMLSFGGYTYIDGSVLVEANCELPEHTHRELVDIAVDIASGIIEHPTYVQLKEKKIFKQE